MLVDYIVDDNIKTVEMHWDGYDEPRYVAVIL